MPVSLKRIFASLRKDLFEQVLDPDFIPTTLNDINLIEHYTEAKKTLGNYVTLDYPHRKKILDIINSIRKYAKDPTRTRPLNVIMIAEPGSGKSFFVKSLAKELKDINVSPVSFNLTNIENKNDFLLAINSVRNLKVIDKLPILFLDEFDTPSFDYSKLLPLLWDGEMHIKDSILKLGKLIIILAGSNPHIKDAIRISRTMQIGTLQLAGDLNHKFIDLLSRINGGVFTIPGLDLVNAESNRKVDKVLISMSLMRARFGKTLHSVPWRLLRFISNTNFRYNVRSLTHLVDLIPQNNFINGKINSNRIDLPFRDPIKLVNSSIANHILTDDGPQEIIDEWLEYESVHNYVKFIDI